MLFPAATRQVSFVYTDALTDEGFADDENEYQEDKTMDNNELNLNELEEISGGKIHFEPEKDKPGWIQHKVTATDTLIRHQGLAQDP